MSTGSFGSTDPERIEDRHRDDAGHRQNHGRRNRDPQHPHHPAVAGGRGKAGLQFRLT